MSFLSKIEWTETTWNPVTGCTKIPAGCENCYACSLAKRLQAMGNDRYKNGFKVTLHEDLISLPLTWKKPRIIFVNSMSDLFHEQVPTDFINKVFDVMNQTPWHIFQVLTKRSKRLRELAPMLKWTPNIWQGVTVENDKVINRIDDLRQVPTTVRFLSLEPLIGPLPQLDLTDIQWVIVGGESGPFARPMSPSWVLNIRNQCLEKDIPFFFKQWGGVNKKKSGRVLEGKIWDEIPSISEKKNVTLF
jgi:protein gp37